MNRRSFISLSMSGCLSYCLSRKTFSIASDFSEIAEKSPSDLLMNNAQCDENVRFCLNLGTIRSYNLNLQEELKVATLAGYHSVEIWMDRLVDYAGDDNGSLNESKLLELKKYLDNEGLAIEGGIGFASWIVDDEQKRRSAFEELKRQSEALALLGCPCIAAPDSGASQRIELKQIADRYATILGLCGSVGVRPLLELWGTSPALSRVADALVVCAEAQREDVALLLDVYHMFRGGNPFSVLSMIPSSMTPVFHMNDYPAFPERSELQDRDRVFPGEGKAPWKQIIGALKRNHFKGALSFEIFNPIYAKKYTPVEQAKIGLEKMHALWNEF